MVSFDFGYDFFVRFLLNVLFGCMNQRPLAVGRATVYLRFHCSRHFTIVVIVECDLLVALFDFFGLFLTVCIVQI